MIWRLVAWFVLAFVQRRVALVGDADRERAARNLREHYAGGYLTVDDLSRRTGRVLAASSRWDVRRALFGLPRATFSESVETVRELVRVVCAGAYVVFTLALGVALALTLLIAGVSTSALVVFFLVWLVPTYLFARLWRRLS